MVAMTAPRSSVTIRNSKDVVVDTRIDIQSGDAGNNKHTDGHTDLTSDQEGHIQTESWSSRYPW
jgi:hypothetical protein